MPLIATTEGYVLSSSQEATTALRVGRIGLIGALIGALIGGIGSFGGAYLTYRQQRDIHAEDVKREAYVTLGTQAQLYLSTMGRMRLAAQRSDQASYAKERERLTTSAYQALYSAALSVTFAARSREIQDRANNVAAAFFSVSHYPDSVKDFDDDAAKKVTDKGIEAIEAFERMAKKDVLER